MKQSQALLKILFIGGTGIISSACARLCAEKGHDLFLLTRGKSERKIPRGAKHLIGDISDLTVMRSLLKNHHWDAVVDFIAYTPEQAQRDIELFAGNTRQYVFISSASVYQKPPTRYPITEDTPLKNPFWTYAQNKISCEELLMKAYRENDFPVTIVRPSHTYDERTLPLKGGYTTIVRLKQGKPVIIHGDGTSLWTLTHHRDFARGFAALLGNPLAVGEAFHITSDEILTWNQIAEIIAEAADAEPNVIHIPSEVLAQYDEEWAGSLLGDKSHCLIFDNSKIKKFAPEFKATIPFSQGAREIVNWYEKHPEKKTADPYWDSLFDRIVADWGSKQGK
ncbi:MAG: SDR family oxidoreductase [Calditrichaeota bacterium]|nr:SDR family oxidoreductase [Calditrichota bacterium]